MSKNDTSNLLEGVNAFLNDAIKTAHGMEGWLQAFVALHAAHRSDLAKFYTLADGMLNAVRAGLWQLDGMLNSIDVEVEKLSEALIAEKGTSS